MHPEHARHLADTILYSEEMKVLHRTPSPIPGFPDAGRAAREAKNLTEYAAVRARLDPDVCGLLALLTFFPEVHLSEIPESTSPEARCAAQVLNAIARTRVLNREELELRGGWSIAVCAAIDELF